MHSVVNHSKACCILKSADCPLYGYALGGFYHLDN